MLLFLSLTGIFLSVILLSFNARKYTSSIYLGLFFFLVSMYGLIQYILVFSKSRLLVALVFVHPIFLMYLVGPMLYWYVRSVLTDDSRLKKKDLWHLLPALIFLLSVIPYLFTPWAEKIENADLLIASISNLKTIHSSLLYNFIPQAVIFISRPALALCYTLASIVIFIRWAHQRRNAGVLSQQRYLIRWLTVLLGFFLILLVSLLLALTEAYSYKNLNLYFTLELLQLFSGIGLTGMLISPFFFPSLLYGMPRFPVEEKGIRIRALSRDQADEAIRQRKGPDFETDYLVGIEDKVNRCMEELKPYLQSECNLAYISKMIGVPAHHLGYYFREVKKQPFNDFRNEWRIKHAKDMIRGGKTDELTLEAIGHTSGFSSRNTFYLCFKKVEGITPSVYASNVHHAN
ncbi:MAG: helix-turn-helix domain-containing protein [Bacteroidales bacterium]|nr:helix-turn-helix domain-containing protein [Bacteroidales bacterium]